MNKTDNIYGKRLKELRDRKNLTQEFIANSVNIRTASISDFENGKTSLKINILRDICNVLNITKIGRASCRERV